MANRIFRNIWPYVRGASKARIVIYMRKHRFLSLTTILGVPGCALIGYKLNGLIQPLPSLVAAEGADESIRNKISRREKRYMEFASKIYKDEIYMTPRDFVESLIKNETRCE